MTIYMPLAELAAEKGFVGGPFGSNLVSDDYRPSGVPVIRGANMGDDGRLHGPFVYVSEEKFESDLVRNTASAGDLVFTQRGTLGQVARLDEGSGTFVISQSQMRLRLDRRKADSRYVLYACHLEEFRQRIDLMAIRTGVPHINLGILKELVIPVVPLPLQQAIAEVLGALDDKIAANRRVLEASDELIRMRYARLEISATAKLGTIAGSVRQQVGSEKITAETTYVGLEHFERERLWLERFGVGSDVTSAKNTFQAGDTLFGKLRPYFHKVSIVPAAGVCSTDVLVIRAIDEECRWLVAAAASSDAAVARAVQNSNGTRMPRAKWEDIAELSVPDPASSEARAFEHLAASLGQRCFAAVGENEALAKTRDELLPLLMLGKIAVKDAEKRVEGVV